MKLKLIALTVATAALFGCGDSGPEYPAGATNEQKANILKMHKIKRLGSHITSAEEEWMGQRLMLKYQPDSIHDGKGWVRSYFMTAMDVMKKLEEAAPGNSYKQIVFDVQLPTVDNLGNKGKSRGMLVQYNWDEIKNAKWENLSTWDAGNLLEKVSFQRLGLESGIEYCQDSDNAKWAKKFCLNVLLNAQR